MVGQRPLQGWLVLAILGAGLGYGRAVVGLSEKDSPPLAHLSPPPPNPTKAFLQNQTY